MTRIASIKSVYAGEGFFPTLAMYRNMFRLRVMTMMEILGGNEVYYMKALKYFLKAMM